MTNTKQYDFLNQVTAISFSQAGGILRTDLLQLSGLNKFF